MLQSSSGSTVTRSLRGSAKASASSVATLTSSEDSIYSMRGFRPATHNSTDVNVAPLLLRQAADTSRCIDKARKLFAGDQSRLLPIGTKGGHASDQLTQVVRLVHTLTNQIVEGRSANEQVCHTGIASIDHDCQIGVRHRERIIHVEDTVVVVVRVTDIPLWVTVVVFLLRLDVQRAVVDAIWDAVVVAVPSVLDRYIVAVLEPGLFV